ncbi:MAG: hypothetical protein A2Y25_10085 [Candidatus Melainabacteria bacterium GWF2_37_15]|nr:MAG: hypothetical protein A2Y25_10085 [Candidatus Melainabacteria bacterium GWF2_37_15]
MINKVSFAVPNYSQNKISFKAVSKPVQELIDLVDTPDEIGSRASKVLSNVNVQLKNPTEDDFKALEKALKRKNEWKVGEGYKDALAELMEDIFTENGRKVPKKD